MNSLLEASRLFFFAWKKHFHGKKKLWILSIDKISLGVIE